MLDWHVAIYCSNEQDRIAACIASVANALAGRDALITVLLNGSSDDSLARARDAISRQTGAQGEIVRIAHGDKSNAINQFLHTLRQPAQAYGAVDGYATVGARSFQAMAARLSRDSAALAVSGVAISGRSMAGESADAIAEGGRLRGQLHAFRGAFVGQLVDRGLRLPIGLYRGDGLLGSMVCHALDAVHEPWANARVPSIADATFAFPVILPLRPSHLRRQFRRMVRQARGRIENAAIKRIIGIGGYEALPAYADDMLRQHLAEHGQPVVSSHARLFQALAIAELNRAVRPAAESLIPERIP